MPALWKKLKTYPKIRPTPLTEAYPTWIIAHRGASKEAPENTLPAFERAMALGADMIEIDVQLSKDGEIMVFHDRGLKRTTNGEGPVSEFSLETLKTLDAGSWFSPEFEGVKIPTLEEVLQLTQGRIMLNIEVKKNGLSKRDPYVEKKILKLLGEYDMLPHTLISSFVPWSLKRIKELNPEVATALLYGNNIRSNVRPKIPVYGYDAFKTVLKVQADGLNLRKNLVAKKFLKKAKECGVHMHPFTIDHPRSMKKLIRQGVSGIITNRPERLSALLKDHYR